MPPTLIGQPLQSCSNTGIPICTLYNSELQLHLFHCLQTVSLLAAFSVQLESMSSKAMSTLGTEELGTRKSEQGDTVTAISTIKKHLKYSTDQHKSVSRVDRAQITLPSRLPKKKKDKEKFKKKPHAHTKLRCCPLK